MHDKQNNFRKEKRRFQVQIQIAGEEAIGENELPDAKPYKFIEKYQAERTMFKTGYDKPISRFLNI